MTFQKKNDKKKKHKEPFLDTQCCLFLWFVLLHQLWVSLPTMLRGPVSHHHWNAEKTRWIHGRCWEATEPRMRGRRGAGRNITTEITQRVTVSCRWQAPSVACLTPEGQGTEEGVGRPRLSVSRSFQRPWPPQEKTHPVRMSVFHARLPPQLPPAPPFSAWLLIILNAVVN